MHSGHRERVKQKFEACGDVAFSDHELLEMLLFYSIPRLNTNDIAHRLIDRFGSLRGVTEARLEELMTVEGVGRNTAILIKTAFAISTRSKKNTADKRTHFKSLNDIQRYFLDVFSNDSYESVYILLLNHNFKYLECKKLCEGDRDYSSVKMDEIVKAVIGVNAKYIVLAHNHPSGSTRASREDIDVTLKVQDCLKHIKVSLLDHFIIANGTVASIIHGER